MTETLHKVQLDGNNNVVLQSVSAQGDITIQTLDWDTFVQRYTYDLQERISELKAQLALHQENKDLLNEKVLRQSQEINKLQAEKESIEAQVKRMIEEYADKDLRHTDARYRQAFELFLAGQLDEALAVLDDAKLEAELRRVDETKRQVAESYTLKANILQLQYDFKAAEAYLHRALRAYPDWGNCLTLANFYKNLNQFPEAEQHYQQCLELANDEEELATTLNNLAVLQSDKNEYAAAESSYQRALEIREQLAEVNPQTYLPYVATTLNNLAVLQRAKNEYESAERSYRRALEIYEQLAEVNPQTYLPDVAMTLNNLANLQRAKNEYAAAERSYRRALEIREQLAEVNPQTYLPYVATTLNNLANLQSDKNEYAAAESSYQRALEIREQLAEVNPQTYLPDVAMTLNNLANLQRAKNEYESAERSYRRALEIRRAFAEAMPQAYDLPVCETSLNLVIFYFNKFERQVGTEEDEQAFVELLKDTEARLQRFPNEIPLVQKYWEYVNHFKQFLTAAEEEAGSSPVE